MSQRQHEVTHQARPAPMPCPQEVRFGSDRGRGHARPLPSLHFRRPLSDSGSEPDAEFASAIASVQKQARLLGQHD
ncbi:hypothetical protein MTO96_024737 [Rhipicephalus appendiculatus]